MKKKKHQCLMLCVAMFVCLQVFTLFAGAQSNKFFYNGKNMKAYNGQSVFVVNVKKITEKDTRNIYRYRKKLARVKTIQYSDKTVSVIHDTRKSLYQACPNVTTLIYGRKLKYDTCKDYLGYDIYFDSDMVKNHLRKLKKIKVSKANRHFFSDDRILYEKNGKETKVDYFYGKEAKERFVIADGIYKLNTAQLEGNVKNVKTLVLNKELKSIYYSDSMNKDCALKVFPNLKKIVIPKENSNYFVQDGCLYEKHSEEYDVSDLEGLWYSESDESDILELLDTMKQKAIVANQPIPRLCEILEQSSGSSKESFYEMRGYISKSGCRSIHVPDCVKVYNTRWLFDHENLEIQLYLPRTVLACDLDCEEQVGKIMVDPNNFMYYVDRNGELKVKYKIIENEATHEKEIKNVI